MELSLVARIRPGEGREIKVFSVKNILIENDLSKDFFRKSRKRKDNSQTVAVRP